MRYKQEDVEVIINENYRFLHNFCKKRFNLQEQDVEDVLQNVFIKVYRNIDKYNGDYKITTWICSILRNESIDFCRSRTNFNKRFSSIEGMTNSKYAGDEFGTPLRLLDKYQKNEWERVELVKNDQDVFDKRKSIVFDIIKKLAKREKSVLEFRLNGFKYEEIAKKMGITSIHARAIGSRGLRKVQKSATILSKEQGVGVLGNSRTGQKII